MPKPVVNRPKTNHGAKALFSKGGIMATKPKLSSLFKGKDDMREELKEARAIKSGKISPMQYAKGEKMEDAKKMACGGKVKKMARGGGVETKGKTRGRFV